MKHEKSCGAMVYTIRCGVLFFLVEQMVKGHFSIPKGHVEGHETEAETALREIREETGLEVRLDTVFRHEVSYSPEEGILKQVVFFAAEALPGKMANQECEVSALEWLPYDEAVQRVTYETDKDVLSHAAVYLGIKHSLRIDRSRLCLSEPGRGVLYREHGVDIHSHIIPRADDGSKSIHETMELLDLDWEEGMRTVIATPHYGEENVPSAPKSDVLAGFDRVMGYLAASGCPMEVRLGTEWYCADDLTERIRNGEAFPMGDTDWYMVEFLESDGLMESADVMLRRLKKLKDNGIKTILAHAERYTAIQEDWDLAKRIQDLGVLLQVNAYDLFLNKTKETKDLARWMAKQRMISFLGSDMHGTRIKRNGKQARRPEMKEGVRWLYENVEYEYANNVVRRNAERLLGVDRLL